MLGGSSRVAKAEAIRLGSSIGAIAPFSLSSLEYPTHLHGMSREQEVGRFLQLRVAIRRVGNTMTDSLLLNLSLLLLDFGSKESSPPSAVLFPVEFQLAAPISAFATSSVAAIHHRTSPTSPPPAISIFRRVAGLWRPCSSIIFPGELGPSPKAPPFISGYETHLRLPALQSSFTVSSGPLSSDPYSISACRQTLYLQIREAPPIILSTITVFHSISACSTSLGFPSATCSLKEGWVYDSWRPVLCYLKIPEALNLALASYWNRDASQAIAEFCLIWPSRWIDT
ncbi:hypothetical protein HHK36_026700 [Tetracentron sinense]|uniref:Uncharacterized protein n=1 Tax=Tetracentron sinense TaxID=13715 RepID=A0A834YFH8_TETSI|nr:hypothetical protein HHK36_026700 [Tetracentron sinense]